MTVAMAPAASTTEASTASNLYSTTIVNYNYFPNDGVTAVTQRTASSSSVITAPSTPPIIVANNSGLRIQSVISNLNGNQLVSSNLRNVDQYQGADVVTAPLTLLPGFQLLSDSRYNTAGDLWRTADALQNTTIYSYDYTITGVNRPVSKETSAGDSVLMEYDTAGNLISEHNRTSANSEPITYEYDGLGRRTLESTKVATDSASMLNVERKWQYPSALQQIYTDRNGIKQTSTLAPTAKTQTTATVTAGGVAINSTTQSLYSNSQLASVTDTWTAQNADRALLSITESFQYDSMGQIKSSSSSLSQPGTSFVSSSIARTYHAEGPVKQSGLSINNQATLTNVSQVDAMGRLTRLTQTGTGTLLPTALATKQVDYRYYVDNALASMEFTESAAAVSKSDFTYVSDGRIQSLSHTRPGVSAANNADVIARYDLGYDERGLMISNNRSVGPTGKTKYFQEVNRFRYDDNGRLTHVSLNNAEFEQIKPQDGAGNSELTTIGAGDRLLEADGYSYSYDAEGNVIQRVYNVATKDRLIIDNTKVQSGKTSLAFDDPGTTATGSYTPEPSIAPTQREYRGTAGFFAITDFFAKAKFFDVTPGSYDLWATWKPVADGALGKFDVRAKRDTDVANVISTGNVDFKLQPNDFIDEAGIRWQKAATIQVKDRDELHVILKKVDIRAAGAIVFDAIQLTPTVVKETYTWDHRNQLAKTTQFNLGGQKTTEVLQNIDAGGRLLSTKTTQFNPRTGAVNSQQTMQHIHDGMNRIADVKVGVAASDAKLNNVYLVDNHGTTLAVNAITPTKAQAANWYFYDTVGAARSVASNEGSWNLIHRVMTVQGTVDRTIGDWRKGNITDSPVIWKGAIQTPITRTYVIGGRTYDSTMNRYLSEDPLASPGSTNRYIVADNNPLASLTPADSLKGTGKSWESQYLKAFSQSYA